ncbi:PREDICTED: melanocyte-stimulating hormone receptor-like [Acropora digitifera]|uniref:melanocyte-stimulating hormone receptor-like n=1 Tax=Acropora digitifera TaxID=70779 RepID=UPI00077AD31E|nr:PREDICTED: melanocyte-stimulating hormone receptor-like [Acropora digitifera]
MAEQVCLGILQRQTQVVQHGKALMLSLCVLNFFCSFTASIGNLLVIYALLKASFIPSNVRNLFLSLALSDLAVGVFVQPIHGVVTAAILMKTSNENYNYDYLCPTIVIVSHASGYLLAVTSFLNITAIAIDRLLALSLHLRYVELITPKRVAISLGTIWFISGVTTSLYMTFPKLSSSVTVILQFVGLVLTAAANIRIYQIVRYHQAKIRRQFQFDEAKEKVRERNSSVNALYLFSLFFACYLPNLCAAILLVVNSSDISFRAIYNGTAFLVLLNSSLNPFIYCWRYREMRHIMKKTVCNVLPTTARGQ